mgnify:CR=1 FL=1
MKKLTLDDKGVIKLLSDLTEHAGKRGIMFQMLLHMLSDDQINMIFNYLHRDCDWDQYIFFKINDKVVFKPSKYEFSNMNMDIMQDKSLICHGYMTGKITGSPDYGNNFNPTYYRMTLDVPILDDDNNIVMKIHDVDTLNLEFMNDYQKDYFKHIWE